MIRMLAGLLAAAALLSGCATARHPMNREFDEIAAQAACCASFRDMPYFTLPPAQQRLFPIDGRSPIYAFRDGRSRFVPIRLPPAASTLRVRSNIVTIWVEPTTFDPFVLFLDQAFEHVEDSALSMRLVGEAGPGQYAESSIRVPTGAAYAVVYTKPSVYMSKRYENPVPLTFGRQVMAMPFGAFPILAGPRGELVLEVFTRN